METLNLLVHANSAESRGIGNRLFYNHSGYWIDKQCIEHLSTVIVETAPGAPEYELILKQYPDIRKIVPAAIYREGKIYLLR